jgi:hypothetical protein
VVLCVRQPGLSLLSVHHSPGTVHPPPCGDRLSALLLQGRVAAQGSYQEVQRHPAVAELLAEFNSSGGSGPAGRPESTSSGADADDDASDTPEVLSPAFLSRLLALNLASGVCSGTVALMLQYRCLS